MRDAATCRRCEWQDESMHTMRRLLRGATPLTLFGIGGLHVMWGRGSTFPFASRDQLNDTVVGSSATPSTAACFGVAGLLTAAGALVAGFPRRRSWLRRAGVGTVTAVLGTRAALGFSGKTNLVSPGSDSSAFRRIDRRVLSPLCLALAIGAACSLRD
jgi:Protein of unknown function (DUF3995)